MMILAVLKVIWAPKRFDVTGKHLVTKSNITLEKSEIDLSKYAWIKEFCKEWLKQRLFGFW